MDKDGVIIKGVGGAYTVLADGIQYVCNPRGVFRNRNTTPLVGDAAIISVTDEVKQIGTLHTIRPRKNELRRPPVANIDQVIITVATAQPAFNAGLLDRFLVLVAYEGIPVLICVNKLDIAAVKTDESFAPYIQAGYPLVYTSVVQSQGLSDLRAHMAGKINVFAGPSGVGKSSLINALSPKLNLETGELSTKLGRGKHTTRHTEIFPLTDDPSGGYCVDTPGFSSLDTSMIPKNELGALFIEFEQFTPECRFNNCLHLREKDCAVKEQAGKAIHILRYESYVKLLEN
ncbi:MAG: ribosome small subunit-dependent GTPase A [Firmicutes bacterium]|nr:ribosome small subunit-dependent GTPase A [Bacillota bacterium]